MKQQEKEIGKSTCIDFQTDVEPKPDGMVQLVESDKSLISFNYQKSRLITIFYQNIWDKPVTGLAYLPGYYYEMKQQEKEKIRMNHIIQTQLGGEPTADESPNLVEFMYAADKCLYFFANGLECAMILKGHPSKKEEI